MGKKTQQTKVIYVGRVSKEKNLEVLCELQDKFGLLITATEYPALAKVKARTDPARPCPTMTKFVFMLLFFWRGMVAIFYTTISTGKVSD